jgi:hypothetical protein
MATAPAVPMPAGVRAIVLAARIEASGWSAFCAGEALAGMADPIERSELARHETPVFVHSGGSPIVVAGHEEIVARSVGRHAVVGDWRSMA